MKIDTTSAMSPVVWCSGFLNLYSSTTSQTKRNDAHAQSRYVPCSPAKTAAILYGSDISLLQYCHTYRIL